MTTTKTFQGIEPGAKSSSRVLRPPGGASNITFGADEEKPVRKDKMASSVFAEPEDPYANRRNNPPGGKPTGVLCGESSAPLRRGGNHTINHSADTTDGEMLVRDHGDHDNSVADSEKVAEQLPPLQQQQQQQQQQQEDEAPGAEEAAAGPQSGRRNPPGGKSSLILG
ncbi:jupiter microtubule associated homolog 1a isoform X2 [Cynoglossus semilaevis]|uniref:jupiter microtubule associated homolog 1a isoform X2 n=1 Tax=Cynoglossus semilaevis TaxID=244447 RepID=UPI0007DC9AE6|nr:jupiter microtubule associated homolog 1-like isoform X2 [Cynoglossus semilaevis]